MRLITIPISHYCERARWALARAGLRFREEQHLQIFHYPHVRRAGARRTVPVLVTEDGVLTDSADIVQLAHERGAVLYPEDRAGRASIEALEAGFAGPFGVETRRLMYFHFLRIPAGILHRYNDGRAPFYERAAIRVTFPLAKGYLAKGLDVREETAKSAERLIASTLDSVARTLEDGRPYLAGDRFSAADLTFAAMSAPLVLPPEHGVPLPNPDELPETLRHLVLGYRAHPAGAFALRLYREDRARRVKSAGP